MPVLDISRPLGASARLWEGGCPNPGCTKRFQIEADPDQPKIDVLSAFKAVRPKGRHVHGSFWVMQHRESGGQ
ncbi:MAG TPA: hypothetical protein DCP37_12590 [Dehalococcoidia bacterium]|jgi:hypothetical protein|nr:hypothetical protein [Dehalococcoidia bacterium]